MRCVAIGGEPATGKTTLVSDVFERLDSPKGFKFGLVRGHLNKDLNIALVGIYGTGGTFLGTDKLAMNVNPHFYKYAEKQNRNIIFEGDRLFTLKNVQMLQGLYETRVIVLKAAPEVLHKRHTERGDGQSDKFLQGRKTKISNIEQGLESACEVHYLRNHEDTINLSKDLVSWLSNG